MRCNEKFDAAIVEDMRNVFLTPTGRRVFTYILHICGYFDSDISSAEEVALRNFATRLVKIMGANQPVNAFYVTDAMLDAVTHIPIPKEEPYSRAGALRDLFKSIRGENKTKK